MLGAGQQYSEFGTVCAQGLTSHDKFGFSCKKKMKLENEHQDF
jgi:hypothetical protein